MGFCFERKSLERNITTTTDLRYLPTFFIYFYFQNKENSKIKKSNKSEIHWLISDEILNEFVLNWNPLPLFINKQM